MRVAGADLIQAPTNLRVGAAEGLEALLHLVLLLGRQQPQLGRDATHLPSRVE
jgi:hypothetical protein